VRSIALGLLLLAAPASAAVLELEHAALARLLATHVMTGGRLYLSGDSDSDCRYSFVQDPRVDAAEGRLRFTFLFSGREAAGVAGRCIGPGGTFDVVLSGVPVYEEGVLTLSEPKLEAPGPGQPFFLVVAPLLERGLAERVRFPLGDLLARASYALSTTWGVQMSFEDVQVPEIEVDDRVLRLRFESRIAVR